MRVLGLDPGTAIMGWGVVDADAGGSNLQLVEYGAITTRAKAPLTERLPILYAGVLAVIDRLHPEIMSIEELFFGKNVNTAISVGQARGVAVLAAAHRSLNVFEYTPMEVKQAVVGYGRAEKQQVQEMVRMILKLKVAPTPDDAADGVALAICHIQSARFSALLEKNRALRPPSVVAVRVYRGSIMADYTLAVVGADEQFPPTVVADYQERTGSDPLSNIFHAWHLPIVSRLLLEDDGRARGFLLSRQSHLAADAQQILFYHALTDGDADALLPTALGYLQEKYRAIVSSFAPANPAWLRHFATFTRSSEQQLTLAMEDRPASPPDLVG